MQIGQPDFAAIDRAGGRKAQVARNGCLRNWYPHPCGYHGDSQRDCRCSGPQIERYRNKISGPLLDRIDIHVEVPSVKYDDLVRLAGGEGSAAIRERVVTARRTQQDRFEGHPRVNCNADMGAKETQTYCTLESDAQNLLKMAMGDLNLSARAYDRILRVSRTIADLEGATAIGVLHLQEAIQYRTLDRSLWT